MSFTREKLKDEKIANVINKEYFYNDEFTGKLKLMNYKLNSDEDLEWRTNVTKSNKNKYNTIYQKELHQKYKKNINDYIDIIATRIYIITMYDVCALFFQSDNRGKYSNFNRGITKNDTTQLNLSIKYKNLYVTLIKKVDWQHLSYLLFEGNWTREDILGFINDKIKIFNILHMTAVNIKYAIRGHYQVIDKYILYDLSLNNKDISEAVILDEITHKGSGDLHGKLLVDGYKINILCENGIVFQSNSINNRFDVEYTASILIAFILMNVDDIRKDYEIKDTYNIKKNKQLITKKYLTNLKILEPSIFNNKLNNYSKRCQNRYQVININEIANDGGREELLYMIWDYFKKHDEFKKFKDIDEVEKYFINDYTDNKLKSIHNYILKFPTETELYPQAKQRYYACPPRDNINKARNKIITSKNDQVLKPYIIDNKNQPKVPCCGKIMKDNEKKIKQAAIHILGSDKEVGLNRTGKLQLFHNDILNDTIFSRKGMGNLSQFIAAINAAIENKLEHIKLSDLKYNILTRLNISDLFNTPPPLKLSFKNSTIEKRQFKDDYDLILYDKIYDLYDKNNDITIEDVFISIFGNHFRLWSLLFKINFVRYNMTNIHGVPIALYDVNQYDDYKYDDYIFYSENKSNEYETINDGQLLINSHSINSKYKKSFINYIKFCQKTCKSAVIKIK